jgi:FKBP-type peptidyl-prolyl cis-trans isomerase FkpA
MRVPHATAVLLCTTLASCASHDTRLVSTPSGLSYRVVSQGTGPSARPGDYVSIHETTSFADGRVHFSTRDRAPIRFLLGGRQVIDGLDEGVTCMKAGERRMLVVPPHLSRRSSYPPDLDRRAVLHYDVTVVSIEPAGKS